jgi:hypothetical protein
MSDKTKLEARLLNASELEMVSLTRYPEIERKSVEELKAVTRRLREAHNRAEDIGARQKREIRGKADPHGTKPAQDNTGTVAKAQVLRDAIERVEAELHRREDVNTTTPSQAELSRQALELKLSGFKRRWRKPYPTSKLKSSSALRPNRHRRNRNNSQKSERLAAWSLGCG